MWLPYAKLHVAPWHILGPRSSYVGIPLGPCVYSIYLDGLLGLVLVGSRKATQLVMLACHFLRSFPMNNKFIYPMGWKCFTGWRQSCSTLFTYPYPQRCRTLSAPSGVRRPPSTVRTVFGSVFHLHSVFSRTTNSCIPRRGRTSLQRIRWAIQDEKSWFDHGRFQTKRLLEGHP